MKRFFILLVVAMTTWYILPAQTQSIDVGYLFVTDLQVYDQKSVNSEVAGAISKGRVAIADDDNRLSFDFTDGAEYIILGSGSFHEYYPLSQEEVPAQYIASADFKKATRKVNVYKKVPTNWKIGKVYTFKSSLTDGFNDIIKVRAVRLSGKNVSLLTDEYSGRSINVSGETLVEIAFDGGYKSYWYNGEEVILANSDSGCSLVVDDKGLTYSQNENGIRRLDSKLSYLFGLITGVGYFGWISDTEIVVSNTLYVLNPV